MDDIIIIINPNDELYLQVFAFFVIAFNIFCFEETLSILKSLEWHAKFLKTSLDGFKV